MTPLKLFSFAVAVTACALLAFFYAHRPERRLMPTELKPVGESLFVTSQLKPESVGYLRRRAINTIVDIRPDGEVSDQPSSAEIKQAADEEGLKFYYIPVPHGAVPADAVRKLDDVLASAPSGQVVLYCRTGNRAVRTYALVMASRLGGPDANAITGMIRQAGFTADDLRDEINRRIAERDHPPTTYPP